MADGNMDDGRSIIVPIDRDEPPGYIEVDYVTQEGL